MELILLFCLAILGGFDFSQNLPQQSTHEPLLGFWSYVDAQNAADVGAFNIAEDGDGLTLTMYKDGAPVPNTPVFKVVPTQGMTFQALREDGVIVFRVVFVEQRPGTELWHAMFLVDNDPPRFVILRKVQLETPTTIDLELQTG